MLLDTHPSKAMDFDFTSGLNLEELKALKELKSRIIHKMKVEEKHDDSSIYLRYLRARDFNVDKAEVMLKNTIEWRMRDKIDNIVPELVFPEVHKYFPLSRWGFDRQGNPVSFLHFGRLDLRGILKSSSKRDCINCVIHHLESDVGLLKSQSEIHGKPVERWIYIFDFESFTFAQATHKASLEVLMHLFQLYESNYPERLEQAFVINASIYFTIFFTIVKPLLSGNTLRKLRIFGTEGWKEELLQIISPEVLPMHYGGTRTDVNGDPKCSAVIKYGGPVPKSYYFRSPERRLAYQPGVKKYSVSRLSKVNIFLQVPEPGSLIEWEFETENRDIGFGLYFQEHQDVQKPMELIPKQRVESHLHCETGLYKCQSPGTYILMFDNSYSWLAQKEVFCRAGVVTPNGDKIC